MSRNARRPVYIGFTEDLSESGFFLATHLRMNVGQTFTFAFHLPDRDELVAGVGEVRWTRRPSERDNVPPGVGVRFVSLEPGCSQCLALFLARCRRTRADR